MSFIPSPREQELDITDLVHRPVWPRHGQCILITLIIKGEADTELLGLSAARVAELITAADRAKATGRCRIASIERYHADRPPDLLWGKRGP